MGLPFLDAAIQEMMAEMAAMRAELDALKQRATDLPRPVQTPTPMQPIVSTTSAALYANWRAEIAGITADKKRKAGR